MIVKMILGLLIWLQNFTMNRHHAEKEMTEALCESKLNRSWRGLCEDACTKQYSCMRSGRGVAQSSLEIKVFHGA